MARDAAGEICGGDTGARTGTGAERCTLCGAAGFAEIYRSASARSLTSLCQIVEGVVSVRFCRDCGHVGSNELPDVAGFYETDYKILINDPDEDQVYEVADDRIVYRTDHQLKVLRDRIALDDGMAVLDYGCAKAQMSVRLKTALPGLAVHLFDVSRLYLSFWEQSLPGVEYATHTTPADWAARFDLVTSYFAFEHIPDPASAARHVASLLKPGGRFYGIVPDMFGNIADFIVADHVNHFTRASLLRLLCDAGFDEIVIDAEAHRGALVFSAVRSEKPGLLVPADPAEIADLTRRVADVARFWTKADRAVTQPEDGERVAIYGAGFYGAFIYSRLDHPETVVCFVDRNPYQQGRRLFNVDIVAPELMPRDIRVLYVGLNPAIARHVMDGQPDLVPPGTRTVFLA